MNQYQKQVQKKLLENEGAVREKLKENYRAALKDVQLKIKKIMETPGFDGEKAFQTKYQKMLSAQLETLLAKLGDCNAKDMTNYLNLMYHDAYLGCLYGMHKDGVDLILKVDEKKVESAVNRDTAGMRFSKRMYSDVEELKKSAVKEIARGFSSGRDYLSIAKQISLRSGISERRAYRIARTEGHRIENEAKGQCMTDAKKKGAEVVKQWDSTLDDKTRTTHRELDGQVRELEDPFEIPSTGARAMYPGGFGIAREDVNCRCCMLQRARWAISAEREVTKWDGDIKSLVTIPTKDYNDYKSRVKGLAAKGFSGEVPKHPAPKYLKTINPKDEQAVETVFNEFEERNRNSETEQAVVITKAGKVYQCFGIKDEVFPNVDLPEEEFTGAKVSHNHPAAVTEYSFSDEDFSLFLDYELEILRGSDYQYTYELSRLHSHVEGVKSIFELQEDEGQNEIIKSSARQSGVGYRRWRSEP